MKDTVFCNLGASNHYDTNRPDNDFYATDPEAVRKLLKYESFNKNILEPCAGQGHISKELIKHSYNVTSYDLINRGYCEVKNVYDIDSWSGDIITNPPYKDATKIMRHLLNISNTGAKVVALLRLLYLESQERYKFFNEYPLKTVYVFSKRINCYKNGIDENKGAAVAYGWFIWEKGYKGDTLLKWIEP